ncbi:hypothetical protein PIIN_01817 [Serendipita indica DSM 11827]|uniref:Uncharacterized protein n=1 Tax=Serendipita indica (strain DSM 11827) TaxID=1109443 RepID=G4T9B2_SERID|nr:hypothetical protein PIIN_01817 [Serendipita indica DSM 11827]
MYTHQKSGSKFKFSINAGICRKIKRSNGDHPHDTTDAPMVRTVHAVSDAEQSVDAEVSIIGGPASHHKVRRPEDAQQRSTDRIMYEICPVCHSPKQFEDRQRNGAGSKSNM